MTYKYIKISRDGAAFIITFNRPERRNAISVATMDELIDAARSADTAVLAALDRAGENTRIRLSATCVNVRDARDGRNRAEGLFVEGGFMGNYSNDKQFLPGNSHESGAFAGVGIHF